MRVRHEKLEEVFSELIGPALEEEELSAPAETYVIEVLTDLSSGVHEMVPRSLFLKDLLRRALDSNGLIRREYLRVTGDVALLISGIFPDSLESRKTCFKLGDYIDIGQVAYSHIQTEVFEELSVKFPQIVGVLNTVSIRIDLTSSDISKYICRRRIINARVTRN